MFTRFQIILPLAISLWIPFVLLTILLQKKISIVLFNSMLHTIFSSFLSTYFNFLHKQCFPRNNFLFEISICHSILNWLVLFQVIWYTQKSIRSYKSFRGVVGYHIRLTRGRSPVRTRTKTNCFFFVKYFFLKEILYNASPIAGRKQILFFSQKIFIFHHTKLKVFLSFLKEFW